MDQKAFRASFDQKPLKENEGLTCYCICRYLGRTTPYSGRAIHVGPFHVHPIHVETDSCPERPIHVRPYSCPNLFVPNGTDSCPTPFMSTYSCPTLFMSDPIHVQKTDSCLTLFMSDPIHVQKDLFMSNIYIKESLTLANLT